MGSLRSLKNKSGTGKDDSSKPPIWRCLNSKCGWKGNEPEFCTDEEAENNYLTYDSRCCPKCGGVVSDLYIKD